jgi:hypothetical protein
VSKQAAGQRQHCHPALHLQVELQRKLLAEYERREQARKVSGGGGDGCRCRRLLLRWRIAGLERLRASQAAEHRPWQCRTVAASHTARHAHIDTQPTVRWSACGMHQSPPNICPPTHTHTRAHRWLSCRTCGRTSATPQPAGPCSSATASECAPHNTPASLDCGGPDAACAQPLQQHTCGMTALRAQHKHGPPPHPLYTHTTTPLKGGGGGAAPDGGLLVPPPRDAGGRRRAARHARCVAAWRWSTARSCSPCWCSTAHTCLLRLLPARHTTATCTCTQCCRPRAGGRASRARAAAAAAAAPSASSARGS